MSARTSFSQFLPSEALEAENRDRMIAAMLPELVERHWMHYFLHNQRPEVIAVRLMRKGKQRIMIVNVPWHMPD